jgi:4'-phosphopantetheinyl transferase
MAIEDADSRWPVVTAPSELGDQDVHVWYARLDRAGWPKDQLKALLSIEERARASKMRIAPVRERFIIGRGLLRWLLGAYLAVDAKALVFTHGAHGKPALAGHSTGSGLEFNLAHSGDHILYAVARRRLGIDIETLQPVTGFLDLAATYFAPVEARALAAQPEGEQLRTFLAIWTRKEALLKATGEGITEALSRTLVPLTPDIPPQQYLIEGHSTTWALESVRPTPGTIAALAVEGSGYRLRCRQLTPSISETFERVRMGGEEGGATMIPG